MHIFLKNMNNYRKKLSLTDTENYEFRYIVYGFHETGYIRYANNENQVNQLRTRFPVVRSARNLHHTKFAQLTSQNPQIKEIAPSRLWGRSLENH